MKFQMKSMLNERYKSYYILWYFKFNFIPHYLDDFPDDSLNLENLILNVNFVPSKFVAEDSADSDFAVAGWTNSCFASSSASIVAVAESLEQSEQLELQEFVQWQLCQVLGVAVGWQKGVVVVTKKW